jgi:hypothetical protein
MIAWDWLRASLHQLSYIMCAELKILFWNFIFFLLHLVRTIYSKSTNKWAYCIVLLKVSGVPKVHLSELHAYIRERGYATGAHGGTQNTGKLERILPFLLQRFWAHHAAGMWESISDTEQHPTEKVVYIPLKKKGNIWDPQWDNTLPGWPKWESWTMPRIGEGMGHWELS